MKERKMRFLSEEEVARLRATPDTSTLLGARDLAVIDTLLGTGMQISEVALLNIEDIFLTTGTVKVKGKKARHVLIPISSEAQESIARYARLLFADHPGVLEQNRKALFLNYDGKRLSAGAIRELLQRNLQAAGIPSMGGRCILRHTFALRQVRKGIDRHRLQYLLGVGRSMARFYEVLVRREKVE